MKQPTRSLLLAALVIFGVATASAQTPSPAPETAKPAGRPDPTIQRIHNQDKGSRIDELRVGGETKSITVQPAADVPAYQIKPVDASHSGNAESGTAGSRFWNVLKF